MVPVVNGRGGLIQLNHSDGNELKTLGLDPMDDCAGQAPLQGIRLDHHEGVFHLRVFHGFCTSSFSNRVMNE